MTFDVDAYLDRQRERFEMRSAARYLAELLARYSELEATYLERLEARSDFQGELLLLRNRSDRFDADYKAGGDPDSLTDEFLQIEVATARLNWRISTDRELGPIWERLKELRHEYDEERDFCREEYFEDEFRPIFDRHYAYLTGSKAPVARVDWGNFDVSTAPSFTPPQRPPK